MSPAAYYRWLHEQPFAWIGLRRLRPRPDQDFPIPVALAIPLGFVVIFVLPLALLDGLLHSEGKAVPGFFYAVLGVLGFTAGTIHGAFSWLTWNQRAARHRAAGTATSSPRPGWFVRCLLGPLYVLLVSFVTPAALLTAVENVRGALAWRQIRAELKAKGECFEMACVIPPPARDEENFFATPFWQQFTYRQERTANGNITNIWLKPPPFAYTTNFALPTEPETVKRTLGSPKNLPMVASIWPRGPRSCVP